MAPVKISTSLDAEGATGLANSQLDRNMKKVLVERCGELIGGIVCDAAWEANDHRHAELRKCRGQADKGAAVADVEDRQAKAGAHADDLGQLLRSYVFRFSILLEA